MIDLVFGFSSILDRFVLGYLAAAALCLFTEGTGAAMRAPIASFADDSDPSTQFTRGAVFFGAVLLRALAWPFWCTASVVLFARRAVVWVRIAILRWRFGSKPNYGPPTEETPHLLVADEPDGGDPTRVAEVDLREINRTRRR